LFWSDDGRVGRPAAEGGQLENVAAVHPGVAVRLRAVCEKRWSTTGDFSLETLDHPAETAVPGELPW